MVISRLLGTVKQHFCGETGESAPVDNSTANRCVRTVWRIQESHDLAGEARRWSGPEGEDFLI
jgi:hypothetical protein